VLGVPGKAPQAASFSTIDFSRRTSVVAAVSGGGDSLALLFLLQDHLARHQPDVPLVAITVDHGIRPEAAAEAASVAALCQRFGIRHRTMRWSEAKPASGLQQAAREARYALLARAAEEAGAELVLTGHTLDDQLETVAMRKRRGDGRGLAGIAPATLYGGRLWIARPLLDVRREELRLYLRGKGIEWHEDPSNEDPRYERVRMRALLSGTDASAAAHLDLIAEARAAAAERVRLGISAAALIRQHARRVSPGLYRLAREFTGAEEREAALYAFRILLAVVGGRSQLPDASRSAALLDRLSEAGARATLSRSVVETRPDGLYLHRERRGLPRPGAAMPGELWDDRHRIGTAAGDGTDIAPFGGQAADHAVVPGCEASTSLVRAAFAAEPALWRGIECLGHAPVAPVAAPWARFLPSFDLAPAEAVTELIGGTPLPPSPLASS
jgi:tRNA(Ile)-lysidine synthase